MFGKAVIPANPKTWEEKGEILQSMEEEIKTGLQLEESFIFHARETIISLV